MYQIDENVPMESIPRGKWSVMAGKMNHRDSVLVKDQAEAARLCQAIRAKGFKASQRKQLDGVRVWKLGGEDNNE
jgi:hypothetical protein